MDKNHDNGFKGRDYSIHVFGARVYFHYRRIKTFSATQEMRDDVHIQIIGGGLYLDLCAPSEILATFCQTWDDENVHKLMDLSY